MPTWKRVVIPITLMLLSTSGFVWFMGLHDTYQDYYNFFLTSPFPSSSNEVNSASNATSSLMPQGTESTVEASYVLLESAVPAFHLLPSKTESHDEHQKLKGDIGRYKRADIAANTSDQGISDVHQTEPEGRTVGVPSEHADLLGSTGPMKVEEIGTAPTLHLIGAAAAVSPVGLLNFSVIPAEAREKWRQWAERWVPTPLIPTEWQALPRIDLWVRTFAPGADKLITILYESVELFWPKHYGQLVILLDNESSADHMFGDLISQIPPFPRVFYQPEPNWSLFPSVICGRTKGYDRQMYSGFYADLYTDAPFIGLVDNDALFTSVVPPSAIFDQKLRPIVIAKTTRYDERGNPFVMGPMNGRWALATTKALGLPQAADFMWNFPVTVRRGAFAEVRAFISKRFNTSFERAFFEIARTKGSYCQINIILNYEWYFHRAKYKWHLQSVAGASQLFINGTYNIPKARVATHARGSNSNDVYAYIRQGYCFGCISLDNCADKAGQKEAQKSFCFSSSIFSNSDQSVYSCTNIYIYE
eukprot:EG_transcript_4634